MTRIVTVTVLKPHHNEYGDAPDKAPAADKVKGTVSEYSVPLDYAEMLERQGLVKIGDVAADSEAEAETPKPAKG